MKSKKWLKAILASRSSKDRSLCMKKTWKIKRRVMLKGVLKYIKKHQKMGVKAAHKNGAVSKALKKKWKTNPVFAKMVIEQNLAAGRIHPSKVQVVTKNLFQQETGVRLKLDFPIERYNADIVDLKRKKAIELDGSYWHGLRTRNKKRRRARLMKKCGWKVLRIRIHRGHLSIPQYQRCVDFLV